MVAKLLVIFHKKKHHLVFILAVILSFTLLYTGDSNQLTQFRISVNNITIYIKSPFSRLNILAKAAYENDLLREQLMVLSLENETLNEYEVENGLLKELLDFKRETTIDLISAKVTSMGLTSNLLSMTIDVGTDRGVKKNDPVLTPSGVVGKISNVAENSAIVQLISDPDFRIGVRFLPSGATGILRWRANNICDVREVYKNSDINVGDRVISSGLSDIFPADLPIGIVTSVTDDRSQFQKIVSIQIEDNLSSLIFVFVIINEETDQ
ncbi:MAG: rod shape-determining protein MreC [Candidatus Neomarinimicrobiota bacterium]